mgnify:CR=1 FL=1|jgi:hypothetical protein
MSSLWGNKNDQWAEDQYMVYICNFRHFLVKEAVEIEKSVSENVTLSFFQLLAE